MIWRVLRACAKRLPKAARDGLLDYAGVLMLVVVPTLWVLLSTIGFASMILPGLDGDFVLGSGAEIAPESRHWITALYISGFGFTTLGVGPFVPQSNEYRLLMVTQAAIGFATFTLAITYLLSVLSALRRRNAFARQVHHLTDGTDDALLLLEAIGTDAGLRSQILLELGRGLHDVHESHLAYPVLHYFRHRQKHFAMSTLAGITADLVSLARAVTPEDHPWHTAADARVADAAARHLFEDLSGRFTSSEAQAEASEPSHPKSLADRLRRAAAAVDVPTIPTDAESAYRSSRAGWAPAFEAFQRDMIFDTDSDTLAPRLGNSA